MQIPFQPQVFASAQSQSQDAAAWAHVLGASGVPVQPLSAWLLLAISRVGTKRTLSNALSQQLAISHKTLESGMPKVPAKFQRSMAHFDRVLQEAEAQLHSDSVACRRRGFARMAQKLAERPSVLPCTFFHLAIAPIGDDAFEQLAMALDDLSTEILIEDLTIPEVATRTVRLAERLGITRPGAVSARPDLDPGLDATLLLLARLDIETASRLMVNAGEITSIFALLWDMSDRTKGQSTRRRLLDLFYGLAIAITGRDLPDGLPSIQELEDALMGGPHEAGTQSWMVRWRGGHKLLRLSDVEMIGAFVGEKADFPIEPLFRQLYLVANLIELIERAGDEACLAAGLRFREWWDAMETPGREKIAGVSPFFAHFQPHA